VARTSRGQIDQVPSLLMVDAANILHKVIVDDKLIREARRCRSVWHSLEELGGINNSHAEKLLACEKAAWEERLQQQNAISTKQAALDIPAPAATAVNTAGATPETVEAEVQRSPDEAYIETMRCSTCNECTLINNKMFAYDGNQQAYIKDVSAGTYAQLVEAAESCQVSVIHPGKPRNPNEPGLEELLKRAELFA
jgi:ferredoxin